MQIAFAGLEIVAAAAIAIAPVSLLNAPPANAAGDEGQYVSDIKALGIGATPQSIITDGYRICTLLSNGNNPSAVAGMLYSNSQSTNGSDGITVDQAKGMVKAAVQDLC
jgi:hypothetical protein